MIRGSALIPVRDMSHRKDVEEKNSVIYIFLQSSLIFVQDKLEVVRDRITKAIKRPFDAMQMIKVAFTVAMIKYPQDGDNMTKIHKN